MYVFLLLSFHKEKAKLGFNDRIVLPTPRSMSGFRLLGFSLEGH